MYGRSDLSRIALEVRSKTEEEVKTYAAVFWTRFKEIAEWQKIVRRIEEGEAVIQRRRELEQVSLSCRNSHFQQLKQRQKKALCCAALAGWQVIVRRQNQSPFPWIQLPLSQATAAAANKGRGRFTEEADCWLLNLTTFFSASRKLTLLQKHNTQTDRRRASDA